ncbi:MAG TPA: uroporphyrinogen-III synthase [Candidatus Dormibacteraeota bacterium]|nr:uroporphyrinogen-III synthase [Candidatus Dormibacteraeota bacterium]
MGKSALAGKRVVITRAASQSEGLFTELTSRGAIPILLPLVSLAALDDYGSMDEQLARLDCFDWIIFTSVNAVRFIAARITELGFTLGEVSKPTFVAAVGTATAEAAKRAGFHVKFIANTHNDLALADELGGKLRGKRIFLPRSDRANRNLPTALRRYGADVTEVIAYRTVRPNAIDHEKRDMVANGRCDAVLFFSPSAVHHFAEVFNGEQLQLLSRSLAMVAVGPVTAGALRDSGVHGMVVATNTTVAAVVDALEEYFSALTKNLAAGVQRG